MKKYSSRVTIIIPKNPSISKMNELTQNLCILDGRNQYDSDYMRSNGFEDKGIGR